MVYTNEELQKLQDKTSMRFFKKTNQYGVTPAQEEKIKKKLEAKHPPAVVVSQGPFAEGKRIVTKRVVRRFKQPVKETEPNEEGGEEEQET